MLLVNHIPCFVLLRLLLLPHLVLSVIGLSQIFLQLEQLLPKLFILILYELVLLLSQICFGLHSKDFLA
jgi:hypothetical protein